jgi:hypothetical protein
MSTITHHPSHINHHPQAQKFNLERLLGDATGPPEASITDLIGMFILVRLKEASM